MTMTALAGCGGGGGGKAEEAAPPAKTVAAAPKSAVYPDDPQVVARATTAGQRNDLKQLWADTLAIRRAARMSKRTSLHGTPAVRRSTAAFLEDLDTATIDNLSKNRAIDHAAAAVATVCGQCFQQLEAVRPIPAIAH